MLAPDVADALGQATAGPTEQGRPSRPCAGQLEEVFAGECAGRALVHKSRGYYALLRPTSRIQQLAKRLNLFASHQHVSKNKNANKLKSRDTLSQKGASIS